MNQSITPPHFNLPLYVASDGISIVRPHPQAKTKFAKQQGYIVARVVFETSNGEPSESSRAYALALVERFNQHINDPS